MKIAKREENMSFVGSFVKIIEESRIEYEETAAGVFSENEVLRMLGKTPCENRQGDIADTAKDGILAFADNAAFMKYLLDECDMRGQVKLVYIDPPFFSKANYEATLRMELNATDGEAKADSADENGGEAQKKIRHHAYKDVWEQGMEEYLRMLCVRLLFIRDLLSDDGTIWVHLDWHSVHYVKVLMDEIFGDQNFINEIIWQYKSGGSSKKHFARKHDNILVYGKTKNYYLKLPKEKSYNRGLKPYRFKGVEEFCDDVGWYTMVNMKDVWNIDMVGRTAKERTGYATQKPEALLERIIESSSCEGDIVADFFCGSGTLGAAASKLGRRWICSDSSAVAMAACVKRFIDSESAFSLLTEDRKQGEIEITIGKGSTADCKDENGRSDNVQLTLFPQKNAYTVTITSIT